MNPWHAVKPNPNKDFTEINVLCEVPSNTRSKYELDKETGLMRLDRVLHVPFSYPANYGFVPQSLAPDNDPLDVLILSDEQFLPETIVRVRVLGMLRLIDKSKVDDKIIAVAISDPQEEGRKSLKDISKTILEEIEQFFKHYKDLEKKKVRVLGFKDLKAARKEIKDALLNYKGKFFKK